MYRVVLGYFLHFHPALVLFCFGLFVFIRYFLSLGKFEMCFRFYKTTNFVFNILKIWVFLLEVQIVPSAKIVYFGQIIKSQRIYVERWI